MTGLPPPPPFVLGVIFALVALSFAFSGTQAAFQGLQKPERERLSRGTAPEQLVGRLLQHRPALQTSLLLGSESANVALTAVLAWWLTSVERWPYNVLLWNLALATPLIVLLGDATPGIVGARHRRAWTTLAAGATEVWFWVTTPLRVVLSGLTSLIGRLAGVEEPDDAVAEEELLAYVDSSTATGQLDPSERDIIEAVFEFDDLTVERLMTPRPDVFSVPWNTPWRDLVAQCRDQELSRVPVTGQTAEDIVGLLLVRDLLRFRNEAPTARQLRSLLLPPIFVPASKPADAMLREFLAKRFHLAFVVDEHGTFVGIVTLDDLLRELLGTDDEDEQESDIALLQPGALTVKASIDIEDFTQETGIRLPEGDYHTLGGFVFHSLGRLPRRGESLVSGRHEFLIAKMEGRRVSEIVVTERSPPETPRTPTPSPAQTPSPPTSEHVPTPREDGS